MEEIEFLEWIYERMIRKHGEYRYYDYMIKFKSIIDGQKTTYNSEYKQCEHSYKWVDIYNLHLGVKCYKCGNRRR